ncbi:hypothetical protein TNCV_2811051 [Trichonephila clavipes]|nr:hypothetical protein TNCV_2811051 [Trichonephila clavipes]
MILNKRCLGCASAKPLSGTLMFVVLGTWVLKEEGVTSGERRSNGGAGDIGYEGNTVPLLKKCNLQVSDRNRRLGRAGHGACPKHARLDSGQESTRAIPYTQLQTCSPPDESSMRSNIIILENKGVSNGSSVRNDMRSKYLVCIPSARQSAITNDMQVRTSAYADSPHNIQPALLYCDLSRTNAGLFRVPPVPPYKNTSGVTL